MRKWVVLGAISAAILAIVAVQAVVAQDGGLPDIGAITRDLALQLEAARSRDGRYPQILELRRRDTTSAPLASQRAPMGPRSSSAAALQQTSPIPTPSADVEIVCPPGEPCPDLASEELPTGLTIIVNTYTAPSGAGYEIVYQMAWGGWLWKKVAVYGPETWRSKQWEPISPLPTPATPVSPLGTPRPER